jgi:rhodanese-related sulfurtransferase
MLAGLRWFGFALLVALAAPSARAEDAQALKPHQAWSKMERGEMTLLDVRTQAEWLQSGVPKSARLVTLSDPRGTAGFVAGAKKAVRGNLKTPVGVICRTGNRSALAAQLLAQAGFKTIYNVPEGVIGDAKSTGWAVRGLPMVSCGDCIPEN